MKRCLLTSLALLGTLTGCASLPTTGDGVVALELLVPLTLTVTPTGTLTLHARALDIHGDSVEAPIRWYTVDPLVIAVDSVSGLVQPLAESGTGRVQASIGTLRSELISITVKAAP